MDLLTLLRMYFPKELPPTFTTGSFATAMDKAASYSFNFKKGATAMLLKHEVPRYGFKRRLTHIPNPIFHHRLCKEIIDNWSDISAIYVKGPSIKGLSIRGQSIPGPGPEISRSSPTFTESASEDEKDPLLNRLKTRALSSHILKADISRCFPSIYTHSIPWALHSKSVAKSNRKPTLLGNRLDQYVRDAQDQQTIGLPIGPYTSVVLSEIVLCVIDLDLQERIPLPLRGTRYVDDYELGFTSASEAHDCLRELSYALREFELELNPLKTEIIKLPTSLEPKWIQQLRKFDIERQANTNDTNIQKRRLLSYFDEVLTLLETNPEEHVLNYALSKLIKVRIDFFNKEIVENFLFQCLLIDSSSFLRVLCLLQMISPVKQRSSKNLYQFADTLSRGLGYHLDANCDLKRSHEVAWALWAMMYWRIPIDETTAQKLSKMDDSIVALMALHARSEGLIAKGLDTSLWEAYMRSDELYKSQWLLCYEANVQGWLPSVGGSDHVSNDPNFDYLKKKGVKFYDPTKVAGFNLKEIINRNLARWGFYDHPNDVNNDIMPDV